MVYLDNGFMDVSKNRELLINVMIWTNFIDFMLNEII